jgi:flagellar motor switch protein FliM
MTMVSPLLAQPCEHVALPGLDQIGERVARGLRNVLVALGHAAPQLVYTDAQITPYADWRAAQTLVAGICRFQMTPIKGHVLMVCPAPLIASLVDLFYGGTGSSDAVNRGLGLTETRLLSRIGEATTGVLDASWNMIVPVVTTLIGTETETAHVALTKDDAPVAVQRFSLSGGVEPPATIAVVYPVAALRPFDALFNPAVPATKPLIDPIWQGRMAEAAMGVRLPLRTIFARPELPVSRLLALQVGDVIPLTLPDRIPVTVAGRLFAQASVGEASGRVAIRIEKIVEGSHFYE